MFMETETARINRLIQEGGRTGLTELQFFAKEIVAWESSPARMEQIKGDAYFRGEQDILSRKRTAIGPDGKLVEVTNLPNNKIIDNQYAKMVNQKTNCRNDFCNNDLPGKFGYHSKVFAKILCAI